jgi:endonuclease/exonuclease/phosphatase (EEP) superfamily protein YafD
MARDQIDLIVITESKRWDDSWNARLASPNYQLATINCTRLSSSGTYRGGVVILYRMPIISASHVTLHTNTMVTCEITFDNSGHQQMINLIGVYINPNPNDEERQGIEKWKVITSECLAHSNSPILVMGDLNTEGRKYLETLKKISPIHDYVGDQATFLIKSTQETRSLDGVFTRNLPNAEVQMDF